MVRVGGLRSRWFVALACAAVTACLLFAPTSLDAQWVAGVVRDDTSDQPIEGVSVMLVAGAGIVAGATTNASGWFVLPAGRAGNYALRAERIGYRPVTTPEFALVPPDTVEVVLRLSVEAVLLAPLTITARGGPAHVDERLARWGYYERRAEYATLGSGLAHFLDIDDIKKRAPTRVTDLFRDLHGVRVDPVGFSTARVRATRGCALSVYLNGVNVRNPFIDELVMVLELAAVEVYASAPYPAQFAPTSARQCGSIVIWTGWVRGK